MSNKNKLIGLSLIALATLCACTEDNHTDGKGNRLVTFSVNAKANGGWSDINGSRSAWMSPQAQQMGEPVEMEGKLNGNSVYLTSEVTEGFPTDNPTFTRGTQITKADGMSSFGVTAFMGSQKYMDHEKITKFADSWKPQTDYFWLNGKPLDFYAWYPYNSAEGTNGIPAGMTLNQENFSSISYTVPTDVSKQEDLMFAVNKNASEPKDGNATSLDFKHSLAAVKFVVGDLPNGVTVKSIKLKNIAKKGNYSLASDEWTVDFGADNLGDFSVLENGTASKDDIFPSGGGVAFLIPQSLDGTQENAGKKPSVEVMLTDGTNDVLLTAALQVTGADNKWKAGKTYTYTINLSGVKAEITFYKGENYTAHNISANGDPFTVDFNYPQTVSNIKLRFAYVNNDGSFEVIKADGNPNTSYNPNYYDLTGKKTSVTLRSPVMNNLGLVEYAKKDATDFVIQMQVKASFKTDMPADPEKPNEKREYVPGTDDGTWYTIWKGKMFPPNYIQIRSDFTQEYNKVIVARNDYDTGNRMNYKAAYHGRRKYWEVDPTHPVFGQVSKWEIPQSAYDSWKYEIYWLWDMQRNSKYPGGNEKFGTKVQPYGDESWYWTMSDRVGDNKQKFVIRGYPTFGGDYFAGLWLGEKTINQTAFVRYSIKYKGIYLDEFNIAHSTPVFE